MIPDAAISVAERGRAAWAAARELARSRPGSRGGWTELQFRLALAATAELSERDAVMRELLTTGPPGRAVVRIGSRGAVHGEDTSPRAVHREGDSPRAVAWVEVRQGALRWGRGEPPAESDVEIIFCNEATAAAALRGQLDQLVALGRGDIAVRGLVPLAETLGRVMDRLGLYFRRHERLP